MTDSISESESPINRSFDADGELMQSSHSVLLLVLAAIVVAAIIVFVSANSARSQARHSPPALRTPVALPMAQPLARATGSAGSVGAGSGVDALFGMLMVGIAGVALYKFIESGSLARLLNRIGDLPIAVNGRTTIIAVAVNDEAHIRTLLMEVIQKKLANLGNGVMARADAAMIDLDS